MSNIDTSKYKPLFTNGKRDKARRYVDSTGNTISRRTYDAASGKLSLRPSSKGTKQTPANKVEDVVKLERNARKAEEKELEDRILANKFIAEIQTGSSKEQAMKNVGIGEKRANRYIKERSQKHDIVERNKRGKTILKPSEDRSSGYAGLHSVWVPIIDSTGDVERKLVLVDSKEAYILSTWAYAARDLMLKPKSLSAIARISSIKTKIVTVGGKLISLPTDIDEIRLYFSYFENTTDIGQIVFEHGTS